MITYKDFLWLTTLTWILPVPFLVRSRRVNVFKWLIACQGFAFLAECVAMTLLRFKFNPNYPSTVYVVLSTIPISLFFFYAIGWKNLKSPFIWLNLFYLIFALTNALFIQKLTPNYYSFSAQNIFILLVCILYYYRMLSDLPVAKLHSDPIFLIVCGWFITYAGKLVLSVTGQYLFMILKDNMLVLWIIFNALTIIGNSIIAYGAYRQWQTVRSGLPASNATMQRSG